MADFFHGAETAYIVKGPQVIKQVKTAVVGLVGTAPIQDVLAENRTINEVVLITSLADAVKYFGNITDGYNIPEALDVIFKGRDGCVVYVINVFDPAIHKDLADVPDPSKVVAADINGGISAQGIRTGVELLSICKGRYGAEPKRLLIGLSSQATVWARIETLVDELQAHAYIDLPAGTSVADAIASRGPSGTLNFNINNKRIILCYPHVKVGARLVPMSYFAVSETISMHNDPSRGYWYSISSEVVKGITGIEIDLSNTKSKSCDVQLLNAAGIMTVKTAYGTGIQFFGNRNASFPTQAGPESFIHHVTAFDVFDESVGYFLNQKALDKPGTAAWRERNVESINGFGKVMVRKGALTAANCDFPAEQNSETEMADGQYTFRTHMMSTPVAERIIHNIVEDITLLVTG